MFPKDLPADFLADVEEVKGRGKEVLSMSIGQARRLAWQILELYLQVQQMQRDADSDDTDHLTAGDA